MTTDRRPDGYDDAKAWLAEAGGYSTTIVFDGRPLVVVGLLGRTADAVAHFNSLPSTQEAFLRAIAALREKL